MYEKTLTDLLIERGIIKPTKTTYILDGDPSERHVLDDEHQNEKKSQE